MLKAEKVSMRFDLISCDTTSNCNIRCKFCFNDWAKIGTNVNMSRDVFAKLLDLLPLVNDNGFFLSCIYEPFINKNFIDYLSLIPDAYRGKCFFTTNLSTPLSDEQLLSLSKAKIDHINISVESFDKKTYTNLCEHSNFEIFTDNLKRLTEVFKKAENPPKIYYITMILRENYYELPFIAVRCKNDYSASIHEFRTPFVGVNMRLNWLDDQILDKNELSRLKEILGCLGTPVIGDTTTDTDSYEKIIKSKIERDEDEFLAEEAKKRYLELRVNSSGIVHVYAHNENYDLSEIEKPYKFFHTLLEQLYYDKARSNECDIDISKAVGIFPDLFCIDRFTDSEGVLQIEGWSAIENENMADYEKYIVITSNGKNRIVKAESIERPDVASQLKNDGYKLSGFRAAFLSEGIKSKFRVKLLFCKNGEMFIKEYQDLLCY